jgi:hypothetical protein
MVPVDRHPPFPIRSAKEGPSLHPRRLSPTTTRRLPPSSRLDTNNGAPVENRHPCPPLKSAKRRPEPASNCRI